MAKKKRPAAKSKMKRKAKAKARPRPVAKKKKSAARRSKPAAKTAPKRKAAKRAAKPAAKPAPKRAMSAAPKKAQMLTDRDLTSGPATGMGFDGASHDSDLTSLDIQSQDHPGGGGKTDADA
jgi:membrane protein involved in colicin uptake